MPRDVLDSILSAPEALSGLLNRALDALPRLRSQGFTIAPSMQAALEYQSGTDPLMKWLDGNIIDNPTGKSPSAV